MQVLRATEAPLNEGQSRGRPEEGGEDGEYREYSTHRGQRPAPPMAGCIGGRMQRLGRMRPPVSADFAYLGAVNRVVCRSAACRWLLGNRGVELGNLFAQLFGEPARCIAGRQVIFADHG